MRILLGSAKNSNPEEGRNCFFATAPFLPARKIKEAGRDRLRVRSHRLATGQSRGIVSQTLKVPKKI